MTTWPDVMNAAEAAEFLGVSRRHVQELCRTRRIPAWNVGGRAGYRIRRDVLESFLAGRTRPATSRQTGKQANRRRAAK